MKANKWRGVMLAASCVFAWFPGPGFIGNAHGASLDCTLCHLDPAPGSTAPDYFEYFGASRKQHPTGVPYPAADNQEFFRPNSLVDDLTFFDMNGNGIPDIDEIRLFGLGAKVECSSCHREHGDTPPPPQPNMYLRVSAALLCMVCHRV
jgi:predicted CXXCH cytochrome family protein